MKKQLATLFFLALLGTAAQAQKKESQPKTGFWVVEDNLRTKQGSIVRFYAENGILIYEEKLEDLRLNISRKKVVKRLDATLSQVLNRSRTLPSLPESENYVKVAFKKN
ncbi:hypothetical protein BWI93_08550 [Siphonobacter sp. BAB-5385]|uniref:hypothetical protein n=1 Tax=unclassified Siphonobacter TaxID=2635712 RepID=UPI000B9ED35C|nr:MULTISPECIES: hypothetical protein [unclassified Siphonobacter]OZI08582.1 hypothetical protein BWI93_08550 [Siphonobacter sp. BAB-5385]PMD90726.1 hypothetical protein BWI97_22365 [Siphonobacter sp. BAB-5405]